jgi:hypothetical protein
MNNFYFPKDTRMLRRSPAQYADGVFQPSGADRPNPLTVSRLLMSNDEVSPGSVSKTGKTALLVFFGTWKIIETSIRGSRDHDVLNSGRVRNDQMTVKSILEIDLII